MNLKKVDVNRKKEWQNNISEWVNERMKKSGREIFENIDLKKNDRWKTNKKTEY